MTPLQIIAKLVKILRSSQEPGQIAGGFMFGMFLGFIPLLNLIAFFIIFLVIIIDVNVSAVIFAYAIFSGFAYLLDPIFHSIGYKVLVEFDFLRPVWVWLYNVPIVPFTRFNNTVVMGSLIVSISLAVPVYVGMKKFVVVYRERIDAKVQKLKIIQLFKASKIYQLYEKLRVLSEI